MARRRPARSSTPKPSSCVSTANCRTRKNSSGSFPFLANSALVNLQAPASASTRFSRDFGHEGERVVVEIAEKAQPKVAGLHPSHQMRRRHEIHPSSAKGFKTPLDVIHFEIQDRAGMVELGLLRQRQHQAN